MDTTPDSASRAWTAVRGSKGDSACFVNAVVNPAPDWLQEHAGEDHKAYRWVWIGPDVKVLLRLDAEPDAHSRCSDITDNGENLEGDMKSKYGRVVDVETEQDATNWSEEGPCYACHDGMGDQDIRGAGALRG